MVKISRLLSNAFGLSALPVDVYFLLRGYLSVVGTVTGLLSTSGNGATLLDALCISFRTLQLIFLN